ncbi:hypothetical protein ACSBL2_08245 [Pedobacter sp. AW31-3R]|uniref:hypothetical protein n=1 Tax=Pedobacter sp. AW31-3R TaxID=3445781 RepID=UPI003FA18E9C
MDLSRFEEYTKAVILAYEKKKEEVLLPPNLQRHTPARLKKECVNVFPERYTEKDNRTFATLFGKRNNAEEYLTIIESADPDIFRPLNNFLKGSTAYLREEANIELLAWLIDFQPRPNRPGDIYAFVKAEQNPSSPTTELSTDAAESPAAEPEEEEQNTEIIVASDGKRIVEEDLPEPKPYGLADPLVDNRILNIPAKFKKTIIAFFAVFVMVSILYIIYPGSQYMYWDGKQYQSIAYGQKVEGAAIVVLDTFRLNHLKKITDLSLITANDIGKVHYAKTDGHVEFYTAGGDHPEDNRKRLLPMTEYIYKKYVSKK